jgi:hypothetical protein
MADRLVSNVFPVDSLKVSALLNASVVILVVSKLSMVPLIAILAQLVGPNSGMVSLLV